MQKIFSISWRFKGFNIPWEQRKLGEVFSERTEHSADGEMLSVTMNDGIVKTCFLNKKDNSSENKNNYKVVHDRDIVYNSMRMWQGASGVSKYNGIVSPAYTILKKNKIHESDFFGYLFKTSSMLYLFKKYSQGLTSDTWNLKYPLLKDINVNLPNINEQKKIVEILNKIDKSITFNEHKLRQLKQLKKFLMQNMFI